MQKGKSRHMHTLDNIAKTNKMQGLTLYIKHIEEEIKTYKCRHEHLCVCALGPYQCVLQYSLYNLSIIFREKVLA